MHIYIYRCTCIPLEIVQYLSTLFQNKSARTVLVFRTDLVLFEFNLKDS